jgi:hypothetical protein
MRVVTLVSPGERLLAVARHWTSLPPIRWIGLGYGMRDRYDILNIGGIGEAVLAAARQRWTASADGSLGVYY